MASAEKDKLMADLSAYLDGELSPERARQVEQFVAESEEARRTLADLRAISKALGDLPRMRAPAAVPEEVRRSAERQILLPERVPAGKARVLQLFARLSASAALIAVCAFVGWTVLQRINPDVPSEAKREIVSGRGGGAEDEARRTFAKRAPTEEELAQTMATGTAVGESAPEAPAIAMADKREPLSKSEGLVGRGRLAPSPSKELVPGRGAALTEEGERLAAKDQPVLAERGVAAIGPTVVREVTPEVNVVVQPRDAAQYAAALNTVASWQQTPPGLAGGRFVAQRDTAIRYGGRRARQPVAEVERAEEAAALRQQDFIVQVPSSRFNDLLLALEAQAPQQVRVEMSFKAGDYARVQEIVTADDAPVPVTDLQVAEKQAPPSEPCKAPTRAETPGPRGGPAPAEPDTFQARRFADVTGSRGRIVRTPSRPEATKPAGAEKAEEDQRVAAYRLREARDTEALQESETLGYVGDSAVTEKPGEMLARRAKKGLDEQRQPRVEDVAAGVPARLAPPSPGDKLEAAGQGPIDADAKRAAELPSAALQIRDHAIEIRERLGEMWGILLGAPSDTRVRETEPKSDAPPPPSPTVTLRVTLLAPPSAATQPGAQPGPSGPDKP